MKSRIFLSFLAPSLAIAPFATQANVCTGLVRATSVDGRDVSVSRFQVDTADKQDKLEVKLTIDGYEKAKVLAKSQGNGFNLTAILDQPSDGFAKSMSLSFRDLESESDLFILVDGSIWRQKRIARVTGILECQQSQ